tara:strand:- start:270 stop:461 length:192 start_codon:yes stop_codon:yes gene_type:complete
VTNLDGGGVELLDVHVARHGLVLPGEDLVQVGGRGLPQLSALLVGHGAAELAEVVFGQRHLPW